MAISMILLQSTGGSVALMLLGMAMLGCWPVVWKHISLKGRNFTHTFLDYCLTYVVLGSFTAVTFGQLGPEVSGTPTSWASCQSAAPTCWCRRPPWAASASWQLTSRSSTRWL